VRKINFSETNPVMLLQEFLLVGYWFRPKLRPAVLCEAFSDSVQLSQT